MSRRRLAPIFCAASILSQSASIAVAETEPLPVIVTYEMKKAREAARIIAQNPRGFWIRQIVARIVDKQLELAKPTPEPLTVKLGFVVAKDGHLVSKTVVRSSGNPDADKTAIAMLERAQPFPPMPDGVGDSEISFTLPVRFR